MKTIRYCVTETIVHECYMTFNDDDEILLDKNELEDTLLEHYEENGSNDIIRDDAEVTYIDM